MADLTLDQLNELCAQLFQSQDNDQRTRADRRLQEFCEAPDCIDKCIYVLNESSPENHAPYTLLVVSQTLMKLISAKNRQVPIAKKLELNRLLFNFLPQNFRSLQPYLLTSLCNLFARTTKQEWSYSVYDKIKEVMEYPFREPIFAIIKSIKIENIGESRLATQMLTHLVSDMSTDGGVESISSHRRSAAQFREEPLLQIFKICVDFLNHNVAKTRSALTEEHMTLVGHVLDLTVAVLTYDFIGISNAEDPGEENTNIQVPNSWKVVFVDGMPMSLLLPLYEKLPKRFIEKVLTVGVQLASIRRSFFTAQDRALYLTPLVEAVKAIATNPQKLEEPNSFHQFTRLVVRVKTNFQLFELLAFKDYPSLLESLGKLTVQSLWVDDVSQNSIYFLLMFWARMVGSVPYHRTNEDHMIGNYVPEIYKAYVESRLRLADRVVMEGIEDPFLDQGSIIQTMEMMATVSRFDFVAAHGLLLNHFDTNIGIIQSVSKTDVRCKCAQARMVWIVTLMGTLIYGKRLVSQPDEMDKLDGQLLARCINFMRVSDTTLNHPPPGETNPTDGSETLELAFLFSLESYRKAYIYTQTKPTSSVYEHLMTDAGLPDELEVIAYFSQKMLNNLRFWALNNTVLANTLDLFREISQGYTAARKLVKLPEIQLLFHSHTPENFAFLRPDVTFEAMKHRTEFYEAVTRVFLVDLNEDEVQFQKFMKPMEEAIEQVMAVIEGRSTISSVEHLQRVIIGALRDIRGVTKACCTKTNYQLLFDWLYPRLFDIMYQSIVEWPANHEIVISVLRLLEDLSQNQQERLKFDLHSCSAVLLFQQISKIVYSYGMKYMELPEVASSDKYKLRYKPVASIFTTVKHALVGGYVPFGVFRLYKDDCLDNVLNTFTKICSTIDVSEIQAYPKLATAFYGLLEMICRTSMPFLSRVNENTFIHMLKALAYGIFALNHNVVTTSCSALDDILTYLYRRATKQQSAYVSAGSEPEGDECIRAVSGHPEILSEMLASMLSALVYSDMKCQWSLSRPMLGLILLQEPIYNDLKNQIILSMAPEHHQNVSVMFDSLMSGVEVNLSVKNKDNFTQNVSRFRQELCSVLKTGAGLGGDLSHSSSDNFMS